MYDDDNLNIFWTDEKIGLVEGKNV